MQHEFTDRMKEVGREMLKLSVEVSSKHRVKGSVALAYMTGCSTLYREFVQAVDRLEADFLPDAQKL